MDEQLWRQVVTEAVKDGVAKSNGRAVPGAKLRVLLAHWAKRFGTEYPPPDEPPEKFADFLKRFEEQVTVLRRQGQDFLVAPANATHLLVDAGDVTSESPFHIRADLFNGFVTVPNDKRTPWYNVASDAVTWLAPDVDASDSLIRIPVATFDKELEDRRAFAGQVEGPPAERLNKALDEKAPLRAFSDEVKASGLWRKWQVYRAQIVAKRIRDWCTANGVPWRDDWLSNAPSAIGYPESAGAATDRGELAKLVERMTSEDMKRISVPLDIVLRLLGPSG